MLTSVLYCGSLQDASGYGEAGRNAVMALRAAGADIKTQRVSFTGNMNYKTVAAQIAKELETREVKYKIKIIHTTPDVYKNFMEKGKYHIGHLFWETDKLPRSWVAHCNQMNEIWTGTKLNADVIRGSGVTVPIYIYPQSINTELPITQPYALPNFNGFLFYSIFDWNERKDPKTLIHAFWKEFKGDYNVGLLVKTHKSSYSEEGTKTLIQEIRNWKGSLGWHDTPRLFIHTNNCTEEEKYRIHKTGQCYVTASRGEGWGLPVAEATLFKNPIISPKFGGIVENYGAREFYQVKHDLVEIPMIYNKYYEPGMHWAQVDEADLRATMRKVYEYAKDTKTKTIPRIRGGKAHNMTMTDFTYQVVGKAMLDRLAEIEKTL